MDNPFSRLSAQLEAIEAQLAQLKELIQGKRTDDDQILDVEGASQLLNLAVPTLYAYTSKQMIPFFKRGKKLYFKRKELLQWIEAGKRYTLEEEVAKIESSLKKRQGR